MFFSFLIISSMWPVLLILVLPISVVILAFLSVALCVEFYKLALIAISFGIAYAIISSSPGIVTLVPLLAVVVFGLIVNSCKRI
jgi:multidrug transporter EmrE-like cation transporter